MVAFAYEYVMIRTYIRHTATFVSGYERLTTYTN